MDLRVSIIIPARNDAQAPGLTLDYPTRLRGIDRRLRDLAKIFRLYFRAAEVSSTVYPLFDFG
jgi:hypothetical protein